ncbi:MAG: 16S rRNA (cytosine(967)-C(5))-methyltransferase RsmB [Burkholderiaceae bacterium]|nr:16S rRNA (cytosine(967)-C(5))-methyltransferase RsmB [Burkholderiaceae bacterium]
MGPPALRAPLSVEMRAAARALAGVRSGRALPQALAGAAAQLGLADASRAATQDIAYTAVRRLGTCLALAALLNERPPAAAIAALQCVALSELLAPARRHEAVVVDQAVAAARLDRATSATAGFLNATLRRFLRERDALLAAVRDGPQARWNAQQWWIEQLRADHPQHWQEILAAGDALPPMTLRVNTRRTTRELYLERLAQCGIGASAIGPQALRLDTACDVQSLPGFAEGLVSVQDLAAQLAAPLLDAHCGHRVLDACAAPGGKSAHLLELVDCELTALDVDAARLGRLGENLQRLGLSAKVLAGDASRPAGWWDGRPFDRILLDAPCSASGIVRRHPDIRWLRRRSDLATLSQRQKTMLAALWPLLVPGGKLLYATCSVFRAEGEGVIEWFCARQSRADRESPRWRWADAADAEPVGQLLPCPRPARDHDGFFYALIRKRP